ncbi:MAG TPA: TIGR02996 domain-containing protein [Gemmataceae bacterium]|nr:TIGR02996 domain-containing protein [Gemmataceae bacterium]
MTDQDAFLDAVFAAPDDDAPRLVYADWLDEHGEPQYADFIRLRCQMARMANGERGWRPLRRKLHWTWAALQSLWRQKYPRTKLAVDQFPRGLPTKRIEVSAEALLRDSDRWWPTLPVRDLRPVQWTNRADQVADCPYLGRLEVLDLSQQRLEIGPASAIIHSPHLIGLKCLWIASWRTAPVTMQLLRNHFGSRLRIWGQQCPPPS